MTEEKKPSSDVFSLHADEAKILSEIGFIAAYWGDILRADTVFDGLALFRPGRAYPLIGKAFVRLQLGRALDAALFLEKQKIFLSDDELDVARAWHGLALKLSGHTHQAQRILNQVAREMGAGCQLAQSLLGSNGGEQ